MLSFICALIIILATAYWAYYGVFSAVIMLGESILSLMVAFSVYEPLANMWKDSLTRQLAEPAFLVVAFFVTLIILRFITDRYIPGSVIVHLAVDRVGGGLFGFLTGMICVGVCLIGAQMLPMGKSTFGFERYTRLLDGTPRRNSLAWFSPDDFTVGLVNMLSEERFSWNDTLFEHEKPAFIDNIYFSHAGTQLESRITVPPDAIKVTDVQTVNQIKKLAFRTLPNGETERNTDEVAAKEFESDIYLVCDVEVMRPPGPTDPATAIGFMQEPDVDDQGNSTPKDFILFTPGQFRLAGPKPTEGLSSRPPKIYPAVGMSDIYLKTRTEKAEPFTQRQMDTLVKMKPDTCLVLGDERQKDVLGKEGPFKIKVVFEIPGDSEFKPWYVEFKYGARALIPEKRSEPTAVAGGGRTGARQGKSGRTPAKTGESGEEPKSDKKTGDEKAAKSEGDKPKEGGNAAQSEGEQPKAVKRVGAAPGGRTHINNVIEKGTDVTDALPRPLPKNGLRGLVTGGRVGEGHVWFELPDKELSDAEAAVQFAVPDGKKLVQVSAEQVYAGSMFGQALEVATRTVNENYLDVADDPDKHYFAQGVYIEAKLGDKNVVEIQYWPEPEVPERCLQAPTKLTPPALRGRTDFKFVFLFVVDPGVKIVRFHPSPKRAQELIIDVPK